MLLSMISLLAISFNEKYTLYPQFLNYDNFIVVKFFANGVKHISETLFYATQPIMDFYESCSVKIIKNYLPDDSNFWIGLNMVNIIIESQKGNKVVDDVVMNDDEYDKYLEKLLDETPILNDKQLNAYLKEKNEEKETSKELPILPVLQLETSKELQVAKSKELTNEEILQFLFKDKNLIINQKPRTESSDNSCGEDVVMVSNNEESKKDN